MKLRTLLADASRYWPLIVVLALFLVLNALLLTACFRLASQIENNLTVIDLAARQHTLAHRITKAVLQHRYPGRLPTGDADTPDGLRRAMLYFSETLRAFTDGGTVTAGGGRRVTIEPLADPEPRAQVAATASVWHDYRLAVLPLLEPSGDDLGRRSPAASVSLAVGHDDELALATDRLRNAVETVTARKAHRLKKLTIASAVMALSSFALVLFYLLLWVVQRDRSEIENRSRNRLLQELIDGHEGILVTRWLPDTTLLLVNQQYADFFGQDQAELIGRRWLELDGDDLLEHQKLIADMIANPRPVTAERFVMAADGYGRWLHWSFTPILDENGRLFACQSVGLDITDRKWAEAELSLSERRFRDFAAASSDWFWETDGEGRISWFSEGIEKVIERPREELYGRTRREIGSSGNDEFNWQYYEARMEARRPLRNFGYRIDTPGGERWLNICGVPFYSQDGGFLGYRGTGSDVTALYTAERALSHSEAKFRGLFERSGIGIVLTDAYGRIQDSNPAFQRMLGYSGEELKQLAFSDYSHPDDAEADQMLFLEINTGLRNGYTLNKRFTAKDGSLIWGHVTVSVIENINHTRGQIIAMVENISESKRLEAERFSLQQQLLEVSRRAGQAEVATGVLHNVGNVLNSLNVSATLAKERLQRSRVDGLAKVTTLLQRQSDDLVSFLTENPKGKKLPAYLHTLADSLSEERRALADELSAMSDNIQHIKQIINRQQVYAGGGGMNESLALADLMSDVLAMSLSDHHKIDVIERYQPLPEIVADKHRLLQILVNLVTNAKQAVSDLPGLRQITIALEKIGDDRVAIEVSDNGIGIAGDDLSKIFGYGYSTKQDGHGFGLHASANAATEMKGELSCRSDGPGKGATFRLELPVDVTVERAAA